MFLFPFSSGPVTSPRLSSKTQTNFFFGILLVTPAPCPYPRYSAFYISSSLLTPQRLLTASSTPPRTKPLDDTDLKSRLHQLFLPPVFSRQVIRSGPVCRRVKGCRKTEKRKQKVNDTERERGGKKIGGGDKELEIKVKREKDRIKDRNREKG